MHADMETLDAIIAELRTHPLHKIDTRQTKNFAKHMDSIPQIEPSSVPYEAPAMEMVLAVVVDC